MQDFGLESGERFYPQYEKKIKELVDKHDLHPDYGVIKKGEALIWHANLLHGGSEQRDLSRSRHSQVTHYFFAGCRYYTPLLSRQGVTTYRNPEWIPAIDRPVVHPGRLKRNLNRLRHAWWRLTD